MFTHKVSVPITHINNDLITDAKVEVFIQREDLNHTEISGNKWFKLKYNLLAAAKDHYETILTFGGAYSNHIATTAAAGKQFGFKTIGVIRGEESSEFNPTLSLAKKNGMQLFFVDRQTYREKESKRFIESLEEKFGRFYLIPEGGSNIEGVIGCSEMIDKSIDFDFVCCPCGTGATLTGIVTSIRSNQKAIGFSSLKGDFLEKNVKEFLFELDNTNTNWAINNDYHFGGYAKTKPELIKFCNDFFNEFQIPLEMIYTGKMMYGIFDLINKRYFPESSKILVIHTGGLQGNKGFKEIYN